MRLEEPANWGQDDFQTAFGPRRDLKGEEDTLASPSLFLTRPQGGDGSGEVIFTLENGGPERQ